MREGWEIKKIGEVCDLMTGGTPSKNKPQYFKDGNIKWLVSGDIHKREILDCEGRITKEGFENSNAKYLPVNSVIIALNGQGKTRGTVALLRTKATCNQSLVSIYPKKGIDLLPEYIFCYLLGKYEEIRKLTGDSGNDRRGLNMPLIRSLEIPVAPLSEQKRIIGILDEVFVAIDKAKANVEKNLQNAKELFECYLKSLINQNWEPKTLKEISTEFARGKSKHRPRGDLKLLGGEYPLIQTGDVSNSNHWITSFTQTYNKVGLAQSKLWPKGTVCIAIVGSNVAETAILNFDACFPDSIIGIIVNETLANNEYVEYLLQTFKSILKEKGKGTARDNINMGTFENQKFPFPPLKIQKEIAQKLNFLSTEIKQLQYVYQQKLNSLEELKKSILRKAFVGELTAATKTLIHE